jgi:drug/metabolite transporter (DMT)-like permease
VQIGEKWMKWAALEAAGKTGSKLIQKLAGVVSTTFGQVIFVTFWSALAQSLLGFATAKILRKKILLDWRSTLLAGLSGLVTMVGAVVVFATFFYGGEIGVNTFIITLSIVPGALIDRFYFQHPFALRQWFGLFIAILAGYSVLSWPSLQEFLNLPLWVWLSFGSMICVTINQLILQKLKDVDPFVNNFWVGGTSALLTFMIAPFLGITHLIINPLAATKLLGMSLLVGFFALVITGSALKSYKGGASLALKKLVMNALYLTSAMILGVLFFQESITLPKLIGVPLYILAFSLTDKKTWEFIAKKKESS